MALNNVYEYGGKVAHLRDGNEKTSICGWQPYLGNFFGDNSISDSLKAETLPKCPDCVKVKNDRGTNS